jgi:glutathione S-transferase
MKLYYAPGACSLGIHVLLEEIGKPYETERVDLRVPAPERPLTRVNPKSKVPTLARDDGSILTEYPAIAYWLARSNPEVRLFPEDLDAQARVLEALEFCVATLHMQGFSRLFHLARLAASEAGQESVRTQAREIITKGFRQLDAQLAGREWLVGAYSIADSALFYNCVWAGRFEVPLPTDVAAHFARMKARPAVQAALKAEGLA